MGDLQQNLSIILWSCTGDHARRDIQAQHNVNQRAWEGHLEWDNRVIDGSLFFSEASFSFCSVLESILERSNSLGKEKKRKEKQT